MNEGKTRSVDVERLDGGVGTHTEDHVVLEEPLEIRIGGETIAVTMRTPGNDRELVMGFLWSEGIVRSPDDVASIAHCGRTGAEARENTIEVTLVSGTKTPLDDIDAPLFGVASRRGTLTASACGVCGRRTIDDLLARATALPDGPPVSAAVVAEIARAIVGRQPTFAATGGCHAASLATFGGAHVATFEDVGRHNAVDKVVGSRLLQRAIPLREHVLLVSGRSSFEIVQKAIVAGIPVVASVSAASSLAVELARRANVTLLGFVRGDRLTAYSKGAFLLR